MKAPKKAIAIALCCVVLELTAQYDFRKIHKIEGLYNESITAITQDHHGFIWIGTHDGLNRFDGYDIKTYRPSNSNLRGRDISSLLLDKQHQLWVGTVDGGLHLYLHEMDSFYYLQHVPNQPGSIESDDIRSIHEDNQGQVWVATKHGLNRYLPESQTFHVLDTLLSQTLVRSVCSDVSGNLWVGTFSLGLVKYNPTTQKVEKFIGNGDIQRPKIQTLISFPDHHLLLGTRDYGLLLFDIETGLFEPFFDPKSQYSNYKNIRAIYHDKSNLWLGTDGNGVIALKYQNNRWKDHPDLSSHMAPKSYGNGIGAFFKDRDNNLWIGSAWEGLRVIQSRPGKIEYIWDIEAQNPSPVWSMYKAGSELLMGSHGNGLFIHDQKTGSVLNYRLETPSLYIGANSISSIKRRSDKRYWLGTYSNGLILFDRNRGQLKQYLSEQNNPHAIAANDIRDVLQDSPSGYWVATWGGGISYFNEETERFTTYNYDPANPFSLSNVNVVDLEPSHDGKIWVATFGGGVDLLDPVSKTFSHIIIKIKNITCLHDDKRGSLWVGTWGKGLIRLNVVTGEMSRFESYEILKSKTVCGILEDKDQNIWFSTSDGVYKYDSKRDSIMSYPDLAGDYHFGSSFKDQKGRFYFGGPNGAVAFDPASVTISQLTPQVKITNFELFNLPVEPGPGRALEKPILYADQVNLDYKESVLTFGFSAMYFPVSGSCEYAIKLENFDQDWRYIGTDRSATYTSLSPGDYEFKVKARVNNSSWPDEYTSIDLHVSKPYWATWYAFIVYGLLIALLFYLFWRYTLYWEKMSNQLKLEQLGREKENELHEVKLSFFTNISHELRTPITLIVGSINRLIEMGITGRSQHLAIESIKKNSSHLLNLVTELLDFRKLESGEARLKVAKNNMSRFVEEIFLSFSESAEVKGITYELEETGLPVELWYDQDEMEKVFYNLITNALKFTDSGGEVTVIVSQDDQFGYVSIRDTGKGIPGEQLQSIFKRFYQSQNRKRNGETGYGLGLAIVFDIIKLHGGEILAESELGEGSTFTIKLPLGHAHIRHEFLQEDFIDGEKVDDYLLDHETRNEAFQVHFEDFSEMTVLIVEDNTGIRDYLHQLLKPHFHVLEAENGKEAFSIVLDKVPDLVLTDVMMPEMDGVTLTGKMKSDPRTSHIPVIILTARTSLIYKKEGLDTGADDYLTKPFSETLLKTRIRNLLHNRLLLREKYKTELLLEPEELALRSPDQEFLAKMAEIVESNMIRSDLTIDHVAKEIGMGQSNIYKKLKALTGMSIVEFIRDFRLKHAAQLIVKQRLSVSEACYKVGFNDKRYFSQVFKVKYGVTPVEYARSNAKFKK